MEQLKMFQELYPESHGQNLALTVLNVPHLLASGMPVAFRCRAYGVEWRSRGSTVLRGMQPGQPPR